MVLFSRKRQDAVDVDGYARKLTILQNILSWVGTWRVESEEGCAQRRGISACTSAGIRQFLSVKLHGVRACPHGDGESFPCTSFHYGARS